MRQNAFSWKINRRLNNDLINRELFAKYAQSSAELIQPLRGWAGQRWPPILSSVEQLFDAFAENGVESSGFWIIKNLSNADKVESDNFEKNYS